MVYIEDGSKKGCNLTEDIAYEICNKVTAKYKAFYKSKKKKKFLASGNYDQQADFPETTEQQKDKLTKLQAEDTFRHKTDCAKPKGGEELYSNNLRSYSNSLFNEEFVEEVLDIPIPGQKAFSKWNTTAGGDIWQAKKTLKKEIRKRRIF